MPLARTQPEATLTILNKVFDRAIGSQQLGLQLLGRCGGEPGRRNGSEEGCTCQLPDATPEGNDAHERACEDSLLVQTRDTSQILRVIS